MENINNKDQKPVIPPDGTGFVAKTLVWNNGELQLANIPQLHTPNPNPAATKSFFIFDEEEYLKNNPPSE